MSTNKDITLYLDNRNPPPVVTVSQGDTDWLYRFTLRLNDAIYAPTVNYVILTGHKPDGHVFAYRGAKSGNLYTVTPGSANGNLVQMTAVAGDVPCELRLISSGRSVGTANFILRVEPGPEGVVTVASVSALPAYTTILQELGVLIGKVETLPDDVPGWIGDWLEAHISGGQGVAVDNTLTVQGAAADAKATGDRIKALEDATIETDSTLTVEGAAADAKAVGSAFEGLAKRVFPLWESGTFYYVTAGNQIEKYTTEAYEKTRKRTAFKVKLSKGTITCAGDYQFNALRTDENDQIVAASGLVTSFEISAADEGDYNIIFKSAVNADISAVDPNDYLAISQITVIDDLVEKVEATEEILAEIDLDLNGGETDADFVPASGFAARASNRIEGKIARPVVGNTLNTVASAGGNVFFFDLPENVESVTFPILVTTEGNGSAFLDGDGKVIQALIYTTGKARDLKTVAKPSGAAAFAISYWNSWINNYPDTGITFISSDSIEVPGIKYRVEELEREFAASGIDGGLQNVRPVPRSTVNALLKCAYTYVDACRAGNLIYSDGTGTNQRAGTICCSTFCRQLLQGIPYNDYLPANASRTTKSGKKWRYGYRLNKDYYADDATATAQQMYDQYHQDGRAFETDFDLEGAEPGDLVVFGDTITSVSHIAMFCFRDSEGKAWLIDSSTGNTGIAIRLRPQWEVNGIGGRNPVGIIRPDLTAVDLPVEDIPVTAENGTITGQMLNGYGHFLLIEGDVTANQAVQYGSDISFTPAYSGKDVRIVHIPAFADGNNVMTYSGVANARCTLRHYLF